VTERVETIRLTATVANYITGMQQAQRATQATQSAAQKLAGQGAAMTNLGHTLLLFGTAVAAGVTLAVKSFADFDAKMSQVKTLSSATSGEMDQLASAAENLGQKIGISANQAADAELELVKAGISVNDILGGALKGSLQLAAAGQIDVAQATEIATIALTQFGLKGKDVPHVADLLAAGADKALGGVSDLGEALKSGGLVASQFGVSLDETVGTLSAFANAGLLGETAGTDLRQMLLKLANPSADSAATMTKLGISLYDASGKFVGLTNLAGQLKDKLGDQTEATRNSALATIFGSRAIAGANVLYKEGAAGIAKWTDEVDTSGFAAKQAAGKMDNLNGDLSKLGAAFQKDLITSGSTANNTLREMVQLLTGLVSAYGNLPAPVQGTVLAIGAVVAVLALASGAFLTIIPRIAATKEAMATLGITMKGTAIAGGITAGALGALTIVLGVFAQQQAEAASNTQEFKQSLGQASGATTKYTRELVAQKLAQSGAFEAAKKAGVGQQELTDAVLNGGKALSDLHEKLYQSAGHQDPILGGALYDAAIQIQNLNGELGTSKQQFADEKAAAAGSADSTQSAADAYQSAATQASNLTDQISQLVDEINKANGVGQDAVTTNAAYQKALDDATKAVDDYVKAHGKSSAALDETTAAGSANADMLAGLAKKNEDAAKAQFALDNNTDNYIATLKAGHQAVYDTAIAFGATADQAQALADKVAAIPSEKQIQIIADTAQAAKTIDQFIAQYGHLSGTIMFRSQNLPAGSPGTFADGGYTGPGPRDKVAGLVHAEEWVSTAATTAKPANRAALEYMHAGGDMSNYGQPMYISSPAAGTGSATGTTGREVNQVFNLNGVDDLQLFATMVSQSSAAHLRGIK